MRIIQYKIIFIVLALATISATAQKTKLLIQEFKVKPDVVIDVNTRYTDIEIETWNKNEVLVEARMKVTGENITEEIEDSYYDKWKFDATGNTDKIKVISRTSNFDIHSFDFETPNYEELMQGLIINKIPDNVSLADLVALDSMNIGSSIEEIDVPIPFSDLKLPPLPPMPTHFNYDTYKKDKSYLERWKMKNKHILGDNVKIKVLKSSLKIKSDSTNGYFKWDFSNNNESVNADEIEKEVKEAFKKAQIALEKTELSRKKALELATVARKNAQKIKDEARKSRKLALVARQEAQNARRKEMQRLLNNRTSVKRIIKIKAPRGAKFNMNVKYGAMSFPKN